MEISPSDLPELRDIAKDPTVFTNVDRALQSIERQLQLLKRANGQPHDKREIVLDTSLTNVGTALIAVVWCATLSPAEQWLLRQRLLRANWDEVEIDLARDSFHGSEHTRLTLIEHKYKGSPRSVVQTDEEYAAIAR
jgi:hypothetical protein